MDQPVRLGLVFPRSGQRLFVMASVETSTTAEKNSVAAELSEQRTGDLPWRGAMKSE